MKAATVYGIDEDTGDKRTMLCQRLALDRNARNSENVNAISVLNFLANPGASTAKANECGHSVPHAYDGALIPTGWRCRRTVHENCAEVCGEEGDAHYHAAYLEVAHIPIRAALDLVLAYPPDDAEHHHVYADNCGVEEIDLITHCRHPPSLI
jgi:hypothetical protein